MGDLDLLSQLILDSSGWKAGTDQARNTTKELKSELTGAFQSIGSSGLIQFATIGGAIGGATLFLKEMVSAAGEDEASLLRLDAVLKSTGNTVGMTRDELDDLATSLSLMTGKEDEVVRKAEAVLLTFTAISRDIFPEAMDAVMNMSAALGQDLQSSAIQVGKALQDPILGVTALRRVGVNFNEAATETIRKLVEMGDVAGADKFILRELETEFGGMAEAMGNTYPGKIKRLQNAIDELGESIGYELLPPLSDATEALILMVTWSQRMESAMEKHADTVLKTSASYDEYVNEMIRAAMVANGQTAYLNANGVARDRERYSIDALAERYGFLTEQQWHVARANEDLLAMPDYGERAASGMQGAGKATEDAAAALEDYGERFNFLIDAAGEYGDYTKDLASAEEQLAADEKALADLRKAGWSEYSQKIKDATQAVEDDKAAIEDLKVAHQDAVYEMIAGWLQYQLTMDGSFTQEDMTQLLDYRKSLGLLTQDEYDAALEAMALADAISALKDKHITVTTEMITIMSRQIEGMQSESSEFGTTTTTADGKAEGTEGWETVPPGYPDDSYPVFLTSGEKFNVIPAGESGGGGSTLSGEEPGGGIVLNNYGTIMIQDGSTAKQDILRQLRG